jgi:adenosylcobinamide-phosphate synthase
MAVGTIDAAAGIAVWYGLLIIVLAVVIDLLLGEPPNAAHPVVWIGKVIGFMDRHTKRTGRKGTDRAKGVLLALVPLLLFPFIFTLLLFLLRDLFGALVWAIACAIILKTMFAINAMGKHTKPIQEALERGDMEAARKGASMIVSRDVNKLDREHIISCAAESAAENTVDSIFSPLFFFGLGGMPLIIFYRVSNTLDAMVGYIDQPYTHVGWFSAKLDDCTNYICARISLPFILLALMILGMDWRGAWRDARKYHKATLSPNKGWSMSAFAGGLGIRFEKVGWYVMGDGPLPTDPKVIGNTVKVMKVSALLFIALVVLPLFLFIGINVQIYLENLFSVFFGWL